MEVAPQFVLWAAEELPCKQSLEIVPAFAVREEQIRHILLAMQYEVDNGFQAGRLFGEYMGLSFATALLKKHSIALTRNAQFKGGLPRHKLKHIIDFVDGNLASDLSLREMADQLKLAPSHFARAFKESVGVSPHQYILRRRIERALQLLKGPRRNLASMACELGFSNQGHFTNVFHRLVGVSPSRYSERRYLTRRTPIQ
jgi:AraC family transcriptional regulator